MLKQLLKDEMKRFLAEKHVRGKKKGEREIDLHVRLTCGSCWRYQFSINRPLRDIVQIKKVIPPVTYSFRTCECHSHHVLVKCSAVDVYFMDRSLVLLHYMQFGSQNPLSKQTDDVGSASCQRALFILIPACQDVRFDSSSPSLLGSMFSWEEVALINCRVLKRRCGKAAFVQKYEVLLM